MVMGSRSDRRARQARATTSVSRTSQPRGARSAQVSSKAAKPGDRLGRHGLDRPGGHQVDPDPVGPEVPGQVAGERLERRLGHAHPVVDRPGHGGVEVEADHRGAGPAVGAGGHQQGTERLDQGLERVGRRRGAPPGPAPSRPGRCRRPGTRAGRSRWRGAGRRGGPTGSASVGRGRRQLVGLGHVDLEHLGLDGQLAGGPPGEREAPPGPAQHDLGALLLGGPGHGEGQGGVGQHAGDQDALSVEESHAPKGYCRPRPAGRPRLPNGSTGASGRVAGEAVCVRCAHANRNPGRYRPGRAGSGRAPGRGRRRGRARVAGRRAGGRRGRRPRRGAGPSTDPGHHRAPPTRTAPAPTWWWWRPPGTAPWPPSSRSPARSPARSWSRWPTHWSRRGASSWPWCRPGARWPPPSRPSCPKSLVSASFHHLPASEMEKLDRRRWPPTCWCARTTPRPPRPRWRWSDRIEGLRRHRRRQPVPGGGDRGVHRRADHGQHPPQGPRRGAAGRVPRGMSGQLVAA